MIDHDPPTLDRLNAARLAYRVGASAAEQCRELLPAIYSGPELARLSAAYTRRAEDFRLCLAVVEAQIASLPKVEIHPDACREDTRKLSVARKAKQVTWREYGLRMWFLRRATPCTS